MANIAFLGNFKVNFSSESHHAKSLKSLGHKVTKLQEQHHTSQDILRAALSSDLFIWVHTHGWKTPGNLGMDIVLAELKQKGIPTMTYHLDLWLGLQREKDLETDPIYKSIGHFFTVDEQMAKWFNKNTLVKGHYIPAGVYDQ